MNNIANAGPATTGAVPALPQDQSAQLNGFIDFAVLQSRVPLCERALREAVRKGLIPSILLPGARKRLFHWPSVEAALRRHERGGAA